MQRTNPERVETTRVNGKAGSAVPASGKGKGRRGKDGKAAKGRGKKKPTMADEADKYELYQASVQAPDVEVKTLRKLYREVRGKDKKPRVLREDFSGTGAISCEWVKGSKERVSYAVDLDPETHEWGQARNLTQLKPRQQERVHWVLGDVRTARTEPADIIAALNFSYFIFKTRDELRAYFKAARDHLKKDGVLITDVFGGYEVLEDDRQEVQRHKGFRYVWDQHKLNPITHDYQFYIHFAFKDGSRLDRAFGYDWRLWSIPEICELMREAGFSRVDVYWEESDDDGEGNGVYTRQEDADADPAWLAYIVGVR